MPALRPRLEVVVVLDGVRHETHTTLKDTLALKASAKGRQLTGDVEDSARLAYFALVRTGLYVGTWDEFTEVCEDIELSEPPPLSGGTDSPAS